MKNKIIKISLISIVLSANLFGGFVEKFNDLGGAYRGGIEIADFDGDNDNDIIIAYGSTNGHIKVYLNDGNENFTLKDTLISGVSYTSLASGDLNGDNHLDILFTAKDDANYTTKIYLNDGNANFTEKTNLTLTGVAEGISFIADFNEDSHNDFLFSGYSTVDGDTIGKMYLNDGSGEFSEHTYNLPKLKGNGLSINYDDLNGDNHKDLLMVGFGKTTSYKNFASIYLNDGNANFTEDTTNTSLVPVKNCDSKIADFNGDNKNDILISGQISFSAGDVTYILLNDGNGNFTLDSNLTGINSSAIDTGDIDGDNDIDIMITGTTYDGSNHLHITELYLNDGNANFTMDNDTLDGANQGETVIIDLDNDSLMDIILSTASTKVYIQNNTPIITEGISVSMNVSEDESNTTTINVTDIDVADTLTWSIKTNSTNGNATISNTPTGNSQVITYIPNGNYSGFDNFTVEVNDSKETDTIDVNVTIYEINDLPYLDKNSTTLSIGENVLITNLELNYMDVESPASSLTYTLTSIPTYGDLNLSGTKLNISDTFKQSDINNSFLTYTNDGSSNKIDSFNFSISDGTDTLNGEFNIKIMQRPIWTIENNSTNEDQVLQIDLSQYATDPDGNTSMMYGAESNNTNLAIVEITNSILSVIPIYNESGVVSIVVYANNGENNSSKTINVTINPIDDSPIPSDDNLTDGNLVQLNTNINSNIVSHINNSNGYDYIAFSDGDNSNKLSVYKKLSGSENWSDIIGINISDNAISSIYYFDIDSSGNLYVGYIDSILGDKLIMYDGTTFTNFRSLKKRALGANWNDMSPPPPFNTGEYVTTVIDRANNIYTAFKDTNNSDKRGMLMRYDGTNWEIMTHNKITTNDSAITNYFSMDEVEDISMAVDSTNRLYIAHIDKILPIADAIIIQTYSNSDNNISYLSGANNGFISPLNPKAKRVLIDVNSSNTLHIAYITNQNSLTVMEYNGSWNYIGEQNIVNNITTDLGFIIDKKSIPYVAIVESNATNKIKIKKYVDSNWTEVDTIIANGEVNNLSLIEDSIGNPYITFNDIGDNNNSKFYFLERYKSLFVKENNLSVGAVNMSTDTSLTFSLSGTDSSLFDINQSGYIIIKSKLNYESSSDSNKDGYYELNVSATDTNSKSAKLFVKIEVEDINNSAITNIFISNDIIVENSSSGTKIGDFNVTAVDSDNNITYTFCDDSINNGSFSITTDKLKNAIALDYEIQNSYVLCIKALDLNSSAYYEKNITINVNDVNEDSLNNQGSYIVPNIDSPIDNIYDSSKKVFEVTQENILNTLGDEENLGTEKIYKLNPKTLKNGLTSQTVAKVRDKNQIIEINLKDDKKEIKTLLEFTRDGVVEIDSNGNVKQTFTTNDNEVELEAKNSGEVIIRHNDLNLEVNSGSNIVVNDDKTIEISKEINIDGKNVNTKINIDTNGEVNAKIEYSNGESVTFNFPTNSNTKGAILEDGALIGEYKALSKFFIVKDNNYNRGVNYGSNSVEIIPLSSEAKFEEKLYLDKNYRGVILRDGEAQILIDGETFDMQENKEYIIIIQSNNYLNSIYIDNYLKLSKGWSLISSPINSEINISKTFHTKDIAYKFHNGYWIKNPKILKPSEGMWIKYDFNIFIYFDDYNKTDSYKFNSDILNIGWNLVGIGSDTNLNYDELQTSWAYNNITREWINNPDSINRGYGFWIKY